MISKEDKDEDDRIKKSVQLSDSRRERKNGVNRIDDWSLALTRAKCGRVAAENLQMCDKLSHYYMRETTYFICP